MFRPLVSRRLEDNDPRKPMSGPGGGGIAWLERARRGCGSRAVPAWLRGIVRRTRRDYLDAQEFPGSAAGPSRPAVARVLFVSRRERRNDFGNGSGGNLIPQSLAVTQALAAYPDGTPLGVKLSPDPSPVYAVRLRVDGQVLRVLVDAQSGQILGQ